MTGQRKRRENPPGMLTAAILAAAAAMAAVAGCAGQPAAAGGAAAAAAGGGTFELVNEVFGYGQDTTKVVLDAGAAVRGDSVDGGTFTVSAKTAFPEGTPPSAIPAGYEGPREVTAVYVTDDVEGLARTGTAAAAAEGRYIVLELAHGREVRELFPGFKGAVDPYGAGTLGYFMSEELFSGTNILLTLDYTVTQTRPYTLASGSAAAVRGWTKSAARRENEAVPGELNPLVNLYTPGRYDDPSGEYLEYSLYVPGSAEAGAGTVPLVVWLHGAGEGRNGYGPQNQNVLRGNEEATAWVKPENQAVRPAFVLVPQSPSFGWTVFNNGGDMVKAVIDGLLEAYPAIDRNRVYIAGDSMGGYGTFYMITTYPGFFAAALTCPGGVDIRDEAAVFSPEQLAAIGGTPLWVVSVVGDTTMPTQMETAFTSLYANGANVRWTRYPSDEAVEVYGNAHWAWVPLLSNLPRTDDEFMYDGAAYRVYREDEPGQTIMDWLFSQRR